MRCWIERQTRHCELSPEIAGKQIRQRLAFINVRQFLWRNELVAKPRKAARIEGLGDPVDYALDADYPLGFGMVSHPNLDGLDNAEVQWHELRANRLGICGQHPDSSALGDGPIMRTADIRAKGHETDWRHARENF